MKKILVMENLHVSQQHVIQQVLCLQRCEAVIIQLRQLTEVTSLSDSGVALLQLNEYLHYNSKYRQTRSVAVTPERFRLVASMETHGNCRRCKVYPRKLKPRRSANADYRKQRKTPRTFSH